MLKKGDTVFIRATVERDEAPNTKISVSFQSFEGGGVVFAEHGDIAATEQIEITTVERLTVLASDPSNRN